MISLDHMVGDNFRVFYHLTVLNKVVKCEIDKGIGFDTVQEG